MNQQRLECERVVKSRPLNPDRRTSRGFRDDGPHVPISLDLDLIPRPIFIHEKCGRAVCMHLRASLR